MDDENGKSTTINGDWHAWDAVRWKKKDYNEADGMNHEVCCRNMTMHIEFKSVSLKTEILVSV